MTKLLTLMLALAACGDDTMGMQMVQPDAGEPPQPDAPAVPRVTVSGTIYDLDLGKPLTPTDQAPLPGVEVCSVVAGEEKTCLTTDNQGHWALSLPAMRKEIGITMTHAGYAQLYNVTATLDVDEAWPMYLSRDADVSDFLIASEMTAPSSTTAAVTLAGRRRIGGEFPSLDGGTMSASAGDGPHYWSAPWQYDANQASTTTAGYGVAAFGGVPVTPGTVDVTINLAGATCFASRQMVPLVGEDTIRVPVFPGFFTNLPVVCE